MYLLRAINAQGDRAYGQECEIAMCIMRTPKPPAEDPAAKAAREEALAKEQTEKKEIKQEALTAKVKSIRGGTGRRTLISSSGGGMGFYNEYKQ